MDPDYHRIYRERARDYDRMVAAEDADRRLLPAIAAATPVSGRRIVEVGAGTGRLTRLLAAAGARAILAVDRSAEMLAVAREHLRAEAPPGGPCLWQLAVADMAALPAPSGWADVAVAGWVLGHSIAWSGPAWRAEVDRAIGEMTRAVAPGGAVVVIETLGTGVTRPGAPTGGLRAYYAHLERAHRFRRGVVRTDYAFDSPVRAAQACRFFFGDELAETVVRRGWSRVPEWTGVWRAITPLESGPGGAPGWPGRAQRRAR